MRVSINQIFAQRLQILNPQSILNDCSNCVDYDLCESCNSNNVHTSDHVFVKIKKALPQGQSNSTPLLAKNLYSDAPLGPLRHDFEGLKLD